MVYVRCGNIADDSTDPLKFVPDKVCSSYSEESNENFALVARMLDN